MKNKKKLIKEISTGTFSILLAFLTVSLINSKAYAKVQVQQSSMENTLFNNQQLIVDKLRYNFEKPERGDIIIFLEGEEKGTIVDDTLEIIDNIASRFDDSKYDNKKDNRLVKRVIGIPGDEVDIKDGYVYLNGKKLEEAYAKGITVNRGLKLPIKVEENKLFVLGDNRRVSKDSRNFGLVDYNQVEGKAIYRVYPFNQIGNIK